MAQESNSTFNHGVVTTCGTLTYDFGSQETKAEMKERHEKELRELKEKKEREALAEAERKESIIFDVVEEDEILSTINSAILMITHDQINGSTKELKKAYNSRIDEISTTILKLKQ